jgi:uncharacterized protein with GYD domain
VHHSKFGGLMSGWGHDPSFGDVGSMSVLRESGSAPAILLCRTSATSKRRWVRLITGAANARVLKTEESMPQYIMLVNFTDQGLKGVREVPNRQDKSRETAKKFGVDRKTVWMTFGPYDFVHLYEAPNDEAMAKFVMTLASFGNVRTTVMRAWDESEHLPLIRELA